jgi:tRNA A-37 threonylcarbamoyl transferase component Bud32
MSTQPGQKIGKYEILDEIGRGGFAVVYKARDPDLDRAVALKVLAPHLTWDPTFAERFHREAQATARLRHPNIVTIYEVGQADEQLYIAMAYLPGRTLQELLEAEGVLPLEGALPILEQIAGALDYAHARGIVHRDIKPSNVIVEETDHAVRATLTDFGLVKAMRGNTVLTSQGTLLGSPEYMAPEQADPERAAEVGPATDRYALGIMAYRMLTGRVPFPGNTPATLNAHEHRPVPPPRSLCPDLNEQVAEALLKMLAKTPQDRFASARVFAAHMRTPVEYARQRDQPNKLRDLFRPTIARKDTTWPGSRRAIPWVVAAALVLLLVAGAVYLALNRREGPDIPYSPFFTYLSQDEDGKSLHLLRPDGTHITLVSEVADVMLLDVSPDRRYLAIAVSETGNIARSTTYPRFIEGSGVTLKVIPADGRPPRPVLSNVPHFDAAYTPRGRLVEAVLRGSKITYTVREMDGSDPHELYSSDNVFPTPEPTIEVREEP